MIGKENNRGKVFMLLVQFSVQVWLQMGTFNRVRYQVIKKEGWTEGKKLLKKKERKKGLIEEENENGGRMK